MTELDLRRFPYEARLAVERTGDLLIDQIAGQGLRVVVDGDELVLFVRDGREVGRIERGFLALLDVADVVTYLEDLGEPADASAVRRRPEVVEDDPAGSYVILRWSERRYSRIHRSLVVPAWPEDDHWRDLEWR